MYVSMLVSMLVSMHACPCAYLSHVPSHVSSCAKLNSCMCSSSYGTCVRAGGVVVSHTCMRQPVRTVVRRSGADLCRRVEVGAVAVACVRAVPWVAGQECCALAQVS